MAYNKKNKYPSIKTPGVYPDWATEKQLGLDNDDLENFSLGNWNSLYRGNKLLLSGNLLDVIKNRTGASVKVRTSPPKNGDRVIVWRYRRNINDSYYIESGYTWDNRITTVQGPIFETLSDYEEVAAMNPGTGDDSEGVKRSRVERTLSVYRKFYGQSKAEMNVDDNNYSVIVDRSDGLVDNALHFGSDEGKILEREDDDSDIILVLDKQSSKEKLNFHAFERAIGRYGPGKTERDTWDSRWGQLHGNDHVFTHELVVVVNFDIQANNLANEIPGIETKTWNYNLPSEVVLNTYSTENPYPENSAHAITLRGLSEEGRTGYTGPNNESTNYPFVSTSEYLAYPDFYDENPTGPGTPTHPEGITTNGGYGYYNMSGNNNAGINIGAVEFRLEDHFEPNFIWPDELRFSKTLTFDINDDRSTLSLDILQAWDGHFNFIGYPTFQLPIAINDPEYVEGLQSFDTPVDFVTYVTTQKGTPLLYYDLDDDFDDYIDASYPVNVKVHIGLLDWPTHQNTHGSFITDDIVAAFGGGGIAARSFLNDPEGINLPWYAASPGLCYYKYQVIQWGDEKQLLTDEQIKNSYFFNFYENDEYPNPGDFFYRKYQQAQQVETVSITEQLEHSYNIPGIKTIKIVVYRYHPNTAFIFQTYLVTKNIVVGDGVLKSQDFSIFGTSDFNFLPIIDNQVIIGGFDEDSKYNNSMEQLVKDDLFTRDEFLDRISSRDFIDKFNSQLLGENISQMDVGNTRMFNKPKDIYDFIGGARFEWINKGSGSLPLNSLATDIFINNDDCTLDLNPSESEYLAIENNFGKAKGILVGDYKLIKTEGAPVIKQGIMETPKIDKNKDRQAF